MRLPILFLSSRRFSSPFASPGPNIKIDSAAPAAPCLDDDIADRQNDPDSKQTKAEDPVVAEKDPGNNESSRKSGQGREFFIIFVTVPQDEHAGDQQQNQQGEDNVCVRYGHDLFSRWETSGLGLNFRTPGVLPTADVQPRSEVLAFSRCRRFFGEAEGDDSGDIDNSSIIP